MVGHEPDSRIPRAEHGCLIPLGERRYNADVTGFQTLNTSYKTFPLTTLSDWGWHSQPPPAPTDKFFADFQYDEVL